MVANLQRQHLAHAAAAAAADDDDGDDVAMRRSLQYRPQH